VERTCPRCGAPLSEVSPALGLASCAACDAVMDLEQVRPAPPRGPRTPADGRGVEVVEGPVPSVSWSWRGATLVFLVPFSAGWNALTVYGLAQIVADRDVGALPVALFLLAVGLGSVLLTVTFLVNRTILRLTPTALEIVHGPLPWLPTPAVPRDEVTQVYVTEVRPTKGQHVTWSLHAVGRRGHTFTLATGLDTRGQARFLEDWLEQRLGLVDRPVDGEHA
jgi:hypothetical protein